MSEVKSTIFHLRDGIEVCGRDEDKSYDNIVVNGTPKYDEKGNLLITKKEENGDGVICLKIRDHAIEYDVSGHGSEFEAVLEDIRKREDVLEIDQ